MMTSIVKQQSLSTLLAPFVTDVSTLLECQLTDISMDSRRVMRGGVFLALANASADRLKHIKQAVERGVFAVLIEADSPLGQTEQAILSESAVMAYPISDLAQQAGYIASRFYQHSSKRMTVIAVTGTNGKTSVSQFIAQALEAAGFACGVIGTMGAGRVSDLELTGLTTPDPVTTQRLLAGFELEGCQYVVMEASSHALQQGRLNSVDIDIAVLTNLSRDHLDYHQTMEHYAAAKMRLFEMSSIRCAVINSNDAFGESVLKRVANNIQIITYSSEKSATIFTTQIHCHVDGLTLDLRLFDQSYSIELPILGRFNADNLLATMGVLIALELDINTVLNALSHCHSVTGRMQALTQSGLANVIIDYAHTPDALEQALKSLRVHLPDNGELWCVFGCGGDRDKGKRPLMGQVAEQQADRVIVTDDNPRTEDHIQIVSDILAGCQQPDEIYIEHDRRAAIAFAITHSKPTDIVLVAGKGHEAYQEINHVKYPFSDAQVIQQIQTQLQNSVYNVAGGH